MLFLDFPAYSNLLAFPFRRDFTIGTNRIDQDFLIGRYLVRIGRHLMVAQIDDSHREPVDAVGRGIKGKMVLIGSPRGRFAPTLALVAGNEQLQEFDLRLLSRLDEN